MEGLAGGSALPEELLRGQQRRYCCPVKLLAVAFIQDQPVVVVGCSLKDSVILTSCQDSVQRHEKKGKSA
jgi:hypothetical protein